MFDDLKGQCKALIHDAMELIYFMRGALSYSEFWEMTPVERQVMADFLSSRLKTELKSNPHPNY